MFRTNLSAGASEGHVVLALRGELDLVDAAGVAAILKALAARDRWIIVDLSGLKFIDVAGVAALSSGRRRARDAGGGLLLAAPSHRYGGCSRSSGKLTPSASRPAWQRQPRARGAALPSGWRSDPSAAARVRGQSAAVNAPLRSVLGPVPGWHWARGIPHAER
jgi:anti-anti-sigma factor